MSEQTKSALEAALQAHVQDESEQPSLLTGYVLAASATTFDDHAPDEHGYWFEATDNQPTHVTRGLTDMLAEWATSTDLFMEDDTD
jgi:hypothetical protein